MVKKYSLLHNAEDTTLVSPYISGWVTPKGKVINGKEWGYDEHYDILEEWGYPFPEAEPDEEDYRTRVIQEAILDGWIRFAGARTERNWIPKNQTNVVNFQIGSSQECVEKLKNVLRNKLDRRVEKIYVESFTQWFEGTPEDFIRQGFR